MELGVAVAVAANAGCVQVTAGADKRWPPLVVVTGVASVPASLAIASFGIAADVRPARNLTVRLVSYAAPSWDALAVGRVAGSDGHFSLSVPQDVLEAVPRAFEAQAIAPGGRAVVAAPLGLARDATRVVRNLDPATTIVAAAARRAGPERHIASWDVDALAQLPEVKGAVDRLATQPATASPSFAPLQAGSDPASYSPEVGTAISAILRAAP